MHLIPQIGRVRLDRLTAQHIDVLHTMCRRTPRPASVRYVHAVLRSALSYAKERRILERNPADGVRPPRVPREAMKALSPAASRRLLDAVAGDELEALYVLAIGIGTAYRIPSEASHASQR